MANRISAQGRERCAAAGRVNVQRAIESRKAAAPALRDAARAFDALLDEAVGDAPTAAKAALRLSASASFIALYTVREKLLAARRFKRIETLISELTPLAGALARTLAALGLPLGDAGCKDRVHELMDLDALMARSGETEAGNGEGNIAGRSTTGAE